MLELFEKRQKIRFRMTETEYLDREIANEGNGEERYEFLNGEIRKMGYATNEHERILTNFIYLFNSFYWETNTSIYSSNRILYSELCNKYFYPDSLAVIGEPEFKIYKTRMKATTNPALIVEISSDSTEEYDHLEKWDCYQTIPSLKQYLMISQKKMKVESYRRVADEWVYVSIEGKDSVIKVLDYEMKLNDLYKKVIF